MPNIHVDTVNPVPLWPVLVPVFAPQIWGVTFTAHYVADVKGLYPSAEACQ